MKLIKLDKRYAGSKRWKYALDFGTRKADHLPRLKYAKGFTKLFGPSRWTNPDPAVKMWDRDWQLFNENWGNDSKRGRIYFNNEADLTAIRLMMA